MNTNINTTLLKTFILEKVGDKLNADEAQTAILIAEKELELRDQHTKISLSY